MNDILDLLGIVGKLEEPPTSPPPSKPKPAPETGSIPDAARAVAEAVRADTGRKKKVDTWKKVAGDVLGLKRMHPKRWQAVLDHGLREDLFEIDESGKYPVLVALDPQVEEEPVEEEPAPDPEPEPEPEEEVPYTPPENWRPPPLLDCGHMNFVSDEKIAAAQAEGHCCASPKSPVHWQALKGKYRRPLPERVRCTKEKSAGPGFPGYCCDDEGYYQGGLANCHLYDNPKGTPCEGCRIRTRTRPRTEEEG